jgi:uroporphyrinogen-III decarboxylase
LGGNQSDKEHRGYRRPVQGNLDPLALLVGGTALDRSVDAILEAFSGGPFIFNLGHGVAPETPMRSGQEVLLYLRAKIISKKPTTAMPPPK